MDLKEHQRAAIVAGLTSSGMPAHRARLIVDIASKAASDGLEATMKTAKLAPDTAAYLSVLGIGMQLLQTGAGDAFRSLLGITMDTPGGLEASAFVVVPGADEGAN